MGDIYTHGHHASVLRSHLWRTADNSAGYLLPHLEPGQRLLDVGCGPGTITVDLGARVRPGPVVGIDMAAEVVAQAAALGRSGGADNVTFGTGDVYALDFPDRAFDVVHAHQVLQHLSNPIGALREMSRCLQPGGLLAVRDSDYGSFVWAPPDPLLDRWLDLYHQVTGRNGAQADAGRFLLGWVQSAGLVDTEATSSTWTFADPEARSWWGDLWAERVQLSSFAEQAIGYGLTDTGELAAIAGAWRHWAAQPDGFFAVVHGEVLARR